ncbi:MAG: glycoside hydrolase family 5 protein [Chitinophagaceae bacterium]|nr:glycoside hydrolase family 5 protein [Chitinophagaceae bacterium]
MKKFVLFLSLNLALASTAQPVLTHGQLSVEGVQLVDKNKQPLILRGMSYGWHNWHPRFYNAASVKWMRDDWKINVIRTAMGIEPDGAYLQKPEWSASTVRTVIEAAIKENIYVIVDWHSHNINQKESIEFFKDIAKRYGKNPHVIYEIFNEPDKETWEEVKAYSIEVIKAIRDIDPDNIILVGSPQWDQSVHLPAADPIKGFSNLMYTMHYYAGTHKQWLRDRCDTVLKQGLPLFISESAGMDATGDGAIALDEWTKWIEWAESRKISWVTWSVSDKDESCSVLEKSASSNGNWKETDLKASGRKARELLRRYNSEK